MESGETVAGFLAYDADPMALFVKMQSLFCQRNFVSAETKINYKQNRKVVNICLEKK